MDDISIFTDAQQPCHANAGLRDGGHLWLRPVIVIRLIIKPDIAYRGEVGSPLRGFGLPENACQGAAVGHDLR